MNVLLKRELDWVEGALNKEFRVTREESGNGRVLIDDIRAEVNQLIGRHLYSYDWADIGDEAVNIEGRFSRRVSSYVYKTYGIKIDKKSIEALGNLAAKYTVKDGQNIVRLDRELWTPGEFGDNESCFFQSRKAAPKLIFRHGGAAVKLFTVDGSPQARAWLVPHYGAAVIFNPYTVRGARTYDPAGVGRVLTGVGAPFNGHALKWVGNLNNYERTNGTVWINNGNGVLVLGKGITEFALYDNAVDLKIKGGATCVRCGDLPDTILMHNGHVFCADCYPLKACAGCSFQLEIDYMSISENDSGERCYYCPACYQARMRTCKCGSSYARHAMRYGGDGVWTCLRCIKRDEDARRNATRFVFNIGSTTSSTSNTFNIPRPQMRPREIVEQLPPGDPGMLFQRVTQGIYDQDRRERIAREMLAREQAYEQAQARAEGLAFGSYLARGPRPVVAVPNDDDPHNVVETIRELGRTLARRMDERVMRDAYHGDFGVVAQDEAAAQALAQRGVGVGIPSVDDTRWTGYNWSIRGAFTPQDEIDNGDELDISF